MLHPDIHSSQSFSSLKVFKMNYQGKNCETCNSSTTQENIPSGDSSDFSETNLWNLKDNTLPSIVLCGLNHLRMQGVLCDVMLVTEQDEHPAHKSILASVSSYFRAMFCENTGFVEAEQIKITLQDTSSTIMRQVLDYIYTAEIEVSEDNVGDLMIASDFLNIRPILKLCSHYLRTRINDMNCIGIYLSAKACNCPDLASEAKRHALENFHNVIQEGEYLNLPFADLLEFLRSNLLNTVGDGELLEIISKWVDHKPSERLQHFKSLVTEIDIGHLATNRNLLTTTSINKNLKTEIDELLSLRCGSPFSNTFSICSKRSRHCAEEEVIIAIGGESLSYVFNSMECYTRGYEGWKCSIPTATTKSGIGATAQVMPPMKTHRSFAAVCSTDYNIFVVGGRNRDRVTDASEFYNVQSNEWSNLSPLPMALHGSGAAYPNQVLCIVGGRSQEQIERYCWAFEEKCNSWRVLPTMEYRRVHHGVASLNGTLYALGGIGGKRAELITHLSSVECYSPSFQSWVSVAPMVEPRAFFGVAVVDMHLYAIGGYNGTSWLRSVERFDPITNQWTTMTSMSAPRSSFGVAVVGRVIYVIGGTDGIHLLNSVEKFNPLTNRWHCSQAMKTCRIGVAAAAVRVPIKSGSPI